MLFDGQPSGPAPKHTRGAFKGQDKIFVGLEPVFSITYAVDPRELVSKRLLARLMRGVNREVMLHWHREMRPVHFTQRGFTQYRMQRRTNATVVIKKERFGHNLPIRQKGVAQSLTGNIRALTVTSTRGRLTMHGPWYLGHRTKRKRGGLSPDLKAELTRVDGRDGLKLARLGARLLRERIQEEKRRGLNRHVVKG